MPNAFRRLWPSLATRLPVLSSVLFLVGVGAAIAQSPTAAAKAKVHEPAVTLLLREPASLDADRVRRVLARVVDGTIADEKSKDGAFVVADGAAIEGRTRGVAWRVEGSVEPLALAPESIRHLYPGDQEDLAAHRARVCLRSAKPCADEASMRAAYRELCTVTAVLLARSVLAIGTAHYGTYNAFDGDVDGWRERLLADDPLDALRPVQETSLVLFLSAPRTLVAKDVAAAFAREWKRPFASGEDGKDDAMEFVLDIDGTLVAKVGEAVMDVGVREVKGASGEQLEKYEELRMRAVMQKQRQLLRFRVSGDATLEKEAERRRLVARAAASLWGDDVLALSWHCDRRLVYPNEGVQDSLRADDPVQASLGLPAIEVMVPQDEAEMDAAIAKAKAEWPTGRAHAQGGGAVFVKFPFATRSGGVEHMWIRVTRVDGERVHGTLDNDPVDVEGLKIGSAVEREAKDLSDWFYEEGGKRVGGYTIDVLTRQAERRSKK